MREHGGRLSFALRLPVGLTRFSFTIVRRGLRLRVSVSARAATYRLADEGTLELGHHGERLTLHGTAPVERPIPPAPEREAPTQPPGREPRRRSRTTGW